MKHFLFRKQLLSTVLFSRNLAVFIAIISGFFVASNIYADTATLSVTQIRTVQAYATADGTFTSGWQWTFDVTVPSDETVLNMKFNNWVSGSNIIPAEGNIRFYSSQSSNASTTGSAIIISATDTYSNAMNIIPGDSNDLSLSPGRQIQITVEAKIPVGSAGGFYSTSYGIQSNLDVTNIAKITSAKTVAHSVLTTALTFYHEADYTFENWTILTGFKTSGDTAIDIATDLEGITLAQNTAINRVDEVETIAETLTATGSSVLLVSPSNGASGVDVELYNINVSPAVPLLSWNPVDGISQYHLQLDTDQSFSLPFVISSFVTWPDTRYWSNVALQYDTTYYWRVRTYRTEDGAYGSWSSAHSFTTSP